LRTCVENALSYEAKDKQEAGEDFIMRNYIIVTIQ
jgi:hypothetical protein